MKNNRELEDEFEEVYGVKLDRVVKAASLQIANMERFIDNYVDEVSRDLQWDF